MAHATNSVKNFKQGDRVSNREYGTGTVVGKWQGYSCASDYEYNWYYIVRFDAPDAGWECELVDEDRLIPANTDGYPYLWIAKRHGLDYGLVLVFVEYCRHGLPWDGNWAGITAGKLKDEHRAAFGETVQAWRKEQARVPE